MVLRFFGAGYESRTRHLLLGKGSDLYAITQKTGKIQVYYRFTGNLSPLDFLQIGDQKGSVGVGVNVQGGGDVGVAENLLDHLRPLAAILVAAVWRQVWRQVCGVTP